MSTASSSISRPTTATPSTYQHQQQQQYQDDRPNKKQMITPEDSSKFIIGDDGSTIDGATEALPGNRSTVHVDSSQVIQAAGPSSSSSSTPRDARGQTTSTTSGTRQTRQSSNNAPTEKKKYVHPKPYKEILGYRFIKTLGQGSMGKVKLAEHIQTKATVAVKIIPRYPKEWTSRPRKRSSRNNEDNDDIPPEVEYDPQRDMRILREAFTLKLLDHPLIVKCIDFVMTDHHYYLVFEYVPGRQLLDYIISHGRLREDKARSILRQIVAAVDYCHKNSVVHRDLKIENIIIEDNGSASKKDDQASIKRLASVRRKSDGKEQSTNEPRIKILDFGLSNFYQKDRLLSTCCGSLYFAAPELLHAQKYTGPEIDIWSIGVIAYVLVCGQVPFDDSNLHVLHAKIKAGKVEYPPYLSQGCVKFLKRLLCVNPKLRATMEEVKTHPWIQGLTNATSSGSASSSIHDPPPFLLSSLGDKFRYLTFQGQQSNQPVSGNSAPRNSSVPYPIENFVPIRQKLKNLPGHHPNPVIMSILKRDPFLATNIDDSSNVNSVMFTDLEGKTIAPGAFDLMASSQQIKRNIHLNEPTLFGFGFHAGETDEILRKAIKSNTIIEHPVMSIYYLLHEWLQKNAGKPICERESGSTLPSASTSTTSTTIVAAAGTITANSVFLESVPQNNSLYGSIYPRQMTEKSISSSKDKIRTLNGPWTSKSPFELSDRFYVCLIEEGFIFNAASTIGHEEFLPSPATSANTGNGNGGSRIKDTNQPSGFLTEWVWRPSLVVNYDKKDNEQQLMRNVQFQIEWVEVLGEDKHSGYTRYAIRCMRKAGDPDLFEKVWERIKWRWEQWVISQ